MTMNTELPSAGRSRRAWLAHGAMLAASPLLLQLRTARASATVTDLAGRQVVIPAGVKRLVLGEGRLLHTLALLEDSADPLARVAGWQGDMARVDPQTWAQYQARYPHIARVPTIGTITETSVSPEKVLSLAPDLAVFGLSGHGPGRRNPLVEQLQAVGVPVVFIDFREHPLTNTVPSFRVLGRALQREAQAERFISFYEAQVRRVTQAAGAIADADRPRTLLDARAGDVGGVLTAGRGSLGELVELAGGRNLGRTLIPGALGEAGLEAVLAAQPEVYVATGYQAPGAKALGVRMGAQVSVAEARESLRAVIQRRQEFASLPAMRQGRVHAAWHHFYDTPFHFIFAQVLAKWLHPQRFAALDPEATWREMHRQFLGVRPTGTYWVSR